MNFRMLIKDELERTERQIAKLQAGIAHSPQEDLYITHNDKYINWFAKSPGSEKSYIKKSNRDFAKLLARKAFWKHMLSAKEANLEVCRLFLDSFNSDDQIMQEFFDKMPDARALLSNPGSMPKDAWNWQFEPYAKKTDHLEELKIQTLRGEKVRSKSEALIANLLYMIPLPYQYEREWILLGEIAHPDFTIRHPKTGILYPLEHFGMMDTPRYKRRALHRIEQFAGTGYYPNINFFVSFETDSDAPDLPLLDYQLRRFFLVN